MYILIYGDDLTIPEGEGAVNLGFVSPIQVLSTPRLAVDRTM
jgi:hypothetical protein